MGGVFVCLNDWPRGEIGRPVFLYNLPLIPTPAPLRAKLPWGWEETIDRAQFTAPKRYKTETDGHATIKAGGINFKKYMKDNDIDELSFDDIDIISSKWEVQRAYRVKGGTIIEFQEKEMSVQKKYIDIYHKNVK